MRRSTERDPTAQPQEDTEAHRERLAPRNRCHSERSEEPVHLRMISLCASVVTLLFPVQIHRLHRQIPVRVENLEPPLFFPLVSILVGK